MNVAILLNANAGALLNGACETRAQEILAACHAANIEASVHWCEPAQLTALARRLAHEGEVDAVVAAGGDGTVSAVAAGLVGTDLPMGVIPLGTLNHFAKDIGIKDVDAAIAAIAAGTTTRIDVGEVNGRVFINNSSIGVYPEFVDKREHEHRHEGRHKSIAILRAIWGTLLKLPLLHVAIAFAGSVFSARTPFVWIGNNEYVPRGGDRGMRPRLDAGQLSLYTLRSASRWRMVVAFVRALLRRRDPELDAKLVDRADIITNRRRLKVAVDGEVVRMTPPLTYRSRPGALVVLGGAA